MSAEVTGFDEAPSGGKPLTGKDFKGKLKATLINHHIAFGVIGFLVLVGGVVFFNVAAMDDGKPNASAKTEEAETKPASPAIPPKDDNGSDRGVPGAAAAAAVASTGAGPVDDAARAAVVSEAASPHPGTSMTGGPGPVVSSTGAPVAAAGSPTAAGARPVPVKSAAALQREAREAMMEKAASTPVGGAAANAGGLLPAVNALASAVVPNAAAATAPAGAAGAGGDDPNLQKRKEAFLQQGGGNAALQPNYLPATRQPAVSPYEIKAGSVLPAVMVGGLNSDLPGMIKAQLRENVYDTATGRYLLIPAWSMLIGTYDSQIAFGQSRVLVVWQRIQFPDGSELPIGGMPGADQGGNAGMTGDVDNHYVRALGGAVLMSMIAGGLQLSTPQQQTTQNGQTSAPTVTQTMAQALGQQLGQLGNTIAGKMLQVQPTITIKPGERFNVMVSKNLVLPQPWQWK